MGSVPRHCSPLPPRSDPLVVCPFWEKKTGYKNEASRDRSFLFLSLYILYQLELLRKSVRSKVILSTRHDCLCLCHLSAQKIVATVPVPVTVTTLPMSLQKKATAWELAPEGRSSATFFDAIESGNLGEVQYIENAGVDVKNLTKTLPVDWIYTRDTEFS